MGNLVETFCESKLADWAGLTLMGICIFVPVISILLLIINFIWWLL